MVFQVVWVVLKQRDARQGVASGDSASVTPGSRAEVTGHAGMTESQGEGRTGRRGQNLSPNPEGQGADFRRGRFSSCCGQLKTQLSFLVVRLPTRGHVLR